MNSLKTIGLAAVAAMAVMAIGAASASATTLEVNGAAQSVAVTFSGSLEGGTSTLWQSTSGAFVNTCTASSFSGKTSTFTAESSKPIGGPISTLSFTSCTTSPVTVSKAGSLSVEWISGTTNGTVRSVGTDVTVPSPIGHLTCETFEGIDIGTLTGKATSGTATIDISAVLNCGFLAPSVTWTGSYWVTSPTGLGVVK
jgi:hypothetical protein